MLNNMKKTGQKIRILLVFLEVCLIIVYLCIRFQKIKVLIVSGFLSASA